MSLVREAIRRLAVSSDKEFFSPTALGGMRRHSRVTQKELATIISRQTGLVFAQSEISLMEAGGVCSRILQMGATLYFRSLGYDADQNNNMIYISA
jgi:hypothetical protein